MTIRAPLPFAPPSRVLVRELSASYASCLRVDETLSIDVDAARAQHAAYVAAMHAAGVAVTVVAADDASPDACFVEDTVVVTGRNALATRPGAASRRAEVAPVAAALASMVRIHTMTEPATLDGGDVLRVADALYVGISSRTNDAGAARLAEVAALDGLTTHILRVPSGLHLKSACTLVDATTLVYDAAHLDGDALESLRASGLTCIAALEAAGANVLAIGSRVFVSASAPATAGHLEARGHDVVRLALTEIHKGDGALTCLSLRIPREGAWST